MSDKPTSDPKSGTKSVPPIPKRIAGAHEKAGYGGRVKMTSPGILKIRQPGKGKEFGLDKARKRAERKFNRGATKVWNKTRPHIPVDTSKNEPMSVPDPETPSSVKPAECKSRYGRHKVVGRTG
jgi:hypothetical protein